MPTATKKRPKRGKQLRFEGMEPPSVPALDDAAETYYEAIQHRVRLSREEKDAKINLIEKMKENGVDRYETPDGLIVTVLSKSNVACKKKDDAEANGDGN